MSLYQFITIRSSPTVRLRGDGKSCSAVGDDLMPPRREEPGAGQYRRRRQYDPSRCGMQGGRPRNGDVRLMSRVRRVSVVNPPCNGARTFRRAVRLGRAPTSRSIEAVDAGERYGSHRSAGPVGPAAARDASRAVARRPSSPAADSVVRTALTVESGDRPPTPIARMRGSNPHDDFNYNSVTPVIPAARIC